MNRPKQKLREREELLGEGGIASALSRIAADIQASSAASGSGGGVALVGIRTGGFFLAERLVKLLAASGKAPPLGAIDIALYRDDVLEGLPRPQVGPTDLPFELPGKTIILIDDVLFTGRTVRSALDALVDYGRARAVKLAVLVDRGHRELPIQADYVGLAVTTTPRQRVRVHLRERGEPDRVVLYEPEDA